MLEHLPILLSGSVFITYIIYSLCAVGKVSISLSATYYDLNERNGTGWCFTLTMALISLFLMPYWIASSPMDIQFLPFISTACLLFVALTPNYREYLQGRVHYVSAYLCAASIVIWLLLMGLWWIVLPISVFGIILTLLFYRKEWSYILEVSTCISLFAGLSKLAFF